jgi:hypothetical protein
MSICRGARSNAHRPSAEFLRMVEAESSMSALETDPLSSRFPEDRKARRRGEGGTEARGHAGRHRPFQYVDAVDLGAALQMPIWTGAHAG